MPEAASTKGDAYWDRAGETGYAEAMYRSSDVEAHVRGRLWQIAIDIADLLGVPTDGRVLDVGCGDGAFANRMLATRYAAVDGIDKSEAAIRYAQDHAQNRATFRAVDLAAFNYGSLARYDAAFLIGILHHIKEATPRVLKGLAERTGKLVILEPNGNHLLRKALEFTPSYRDAGEDSFRTQELIDILNAAGWHTVVKRRLNLFPNFTPGPIYRWLAPLEPKVEASSF